MNNEIAADIISKYWGMSKDELLWMSLNHMDIIDDEFAWQDHATPDVICNQMINLYKESFDNQQKILILFNLEFIKSIYINYEDILYKNIYFVADTEAKYNWITKNFPKINCAYLDMHDINKLNECIKGFNVKKFDVIFSNPPYNGNLDLKILKSLFEQKISNKIVFVHPAGYLLDKKFKTKLYNELRNTNYLESVYMFWGNKLFDIKLFMPCCISVWDINKTNAECSVTDNAFINWTGNESKYNCKINDISIHGKIFENVKHFLKCDNNILTHITNENDLTDYSVKFALIRGGQEYGQGIYSHFYSIIGLDTENYKCDHTFRFPAHIIKTHKLHWTFNNDDERNNFLYYCKTKMVRFILSCYKSTSHIDNGELEVIPWLDFTKEWDDAKLCKEFGISEDLWNYIDNFIPDYYNDYKSGF